MNPLIASLTKKKNKINYLMNTDLLIQKINFEISPKLSKLIVVKTAVKLTAYN